MTIQITGKNIEAGEALQAYVRGKIDQVVGKYVGNHGLTGHVRVERERGQFHTDCTIQLRSGLVLEAQGVAGDAYASADAAFEHLEKRIRRYKRRLKNHHHGDQHMRALDGAEAPDYVVRADNEDETVAEEPAPVIVAETRRAIRMSSVSEAVMELDVSNQPFLIFRNAAHGGVNVVYRRADGNIGWVDPGSQS